MDNPKDENHILLDCDVHFQSWTRVIDCFDLDFFPITISYKVCESVYMLRECC